MAVDTIVVSASRPARPGVVILEDRANAGTGTTNSPTKVVGGVGGHVPDSAGAILGRVRLKAVNAGTPTLDVDIEDSWDQTNWMSIASFTQLVTTGEETKALTRLPGPFLRSNSVVGGTTPDIDFEVDIVGVELSNV